MQFSPRSVFIPLRSKYPPQQPVLKDSQSVFLSQIARPSFALHVLYAMDGLDISCTFLTYANCWPISGHRTEVHTLHEEYLTSSCL